MIFVKDYNKLHTYVQKNILQKLLYLYICIVLYSKYILRKNIFRDALVVQLAFWEY